MGSSPEIGPELLLLHALPLDASMWAGQQDILPGATYAPTLYGLGDSIEEWASVVLRVAHSRRLILVGCSIGGSCALEIAAAAPDRVAALILIGTKAAHHPDPDLCSSALSVLDKHGMETAWEIFWRPLFSRTARADILKDAREIALRQAPSDVARGITAFHSRKSRDAVLAGFPRPVFMVSGAEDVAPGPKTSAFQAASASAGRLHIVPECGHYVPMECSDWLNALLGQVIALERERAL